MILNSMMSTMKHPYRLWGRICLGIVALSISACSADDSYSYRGMSGINFTSDTLYFSFGALPFNVSDTVIRIPVEVLGMPEDFPRTYRMEIDETVTDALPGIHYADFSLERSVPANALHDTISIRIFRQNLDEQTLYTLGLRLILSQEFPAQIREFHRIGIGFSNRLDRPEWWQQLSYWLGEYDPRKYRKFIEFYGRPVTEAEVSDNPYSVLRVFKKVRDFFMEHPHYKVIFPDVHWEV